MSKILVDRELLELLRNFTFLHDDGCAGALRGNIDKALAARPAEAEGAGIKKFEFEIGEGGPVTEPLVRYKDHLAALSAVTAERDRLDELSEALGQQISDAGQREIAYRAEVEALRKDAARLDFMVSQRALINSQNGTASPTVYRVCWPSESRQWADWYPSERDAIDAAMAAKEA